MEGNESRSLEVLTSHLRAGYLHKNGVPYSDKTKGGRSAVGTLSTNGGLVFVGEDSGVFTALDGKTGKPLWHFPVNQGLRASPMTFMVEGKQYVTIAAPAGFLTFGLTDR